MACGACGFEGHADVAGSENFLASVIAEEGLDVELEFEVYDTEGPMARPAARGQNSPRDGHSGVPCLQWDDHAWTVKHAGHGRATVKTNEDPANRSTRERNFASTSAADRRTHRGIPRL